MSRMSTIALIAFSMPLLTFKFDNGLVVIALIAEDILLLSSFTTLSECSSAAELMMSLKFR